MSNLPKIKAFCDAGCAWETIHRSEFEKSASMVQKYPDSDGFITVSAPNKKYKIVSEQTDTAYTAAVTLSIPLGDGSQVSFGLAAAEFDSLRNYFYVDILSVKAEILARRAVVDYEVNGKRYNHYWQDLSSTDIQVDKATLVISDATAVYLVNTEAEVLAKDGEDGVPLKPCFISTTDTFPTEFPSEYSGVVVSGDAVIGNLAIVNYTSEGKGAYGYITAISDVIATINLVGVFCRNGELYEYTLTVDEVTDSSTVTRLYNIATKAKGAVYVKDNSGYSYQITRSDYVRVATVVRRLVTFTREYSISPNFNKVEYTATVVNNSLGTTKSEIVFSSTGTTITETAGGWTSLTITYYNDIEITA